MVGERFRGAEVVLARDGGASESENVGMSNRKSGEILGHRKPKVSSAMYIIGGLAGPKANFGPTEVVDGKRINISAPVTAL